MRAKQFLSRIPVPAQVKLVYARLTLNRLTTFYFVTAVVHCVLQVILQLAAHAINVDARHLVSHILEQAKLTMDKFALVETGRRSPRARESDVVLTLCRGIPGQYGLTGKDVCNVLWSQNRGLVNETVEDFLSPSSEDDDNNQESSSDSDEERTSTPLPLLASSSESKRPQRSSSSSTAFSTAVPSTLPLAIVPITTRSTLAVSTSSSFAQTSTSSFATSTSTSSFATSTSTSRALPTTTSNPPDSPTTSSLAFPAPTGGSNLIQPNPDSSDSNDSNNSSEDEAEPALVKLRRRRALKRTKVVVEKKDGQRRLFDREKIRPLSLPPRPRAPAPAPLAESSIDIDESHPQLETHIRRARVAPLTNSLLSRTQEGTRVEFVPIALRAVGSKRLLPPRPKRSKHSKRALSRRTLTDQDLQNVKITPLFSFAPESDDEKKNPVPDANSTTAMKSTIAKPKLVSVKVAGLLGSGLGAGILAESGTANNTATFGEVELSPGCVLALSWPAQVLRDFAHEDLATIGFQAWLLGMTIVAILNESVPHLVAGVFTQALSTGWSAFQMARSASFRAQYETIIVRGACSGVDVLPDYFPHRTKDEIPIVVINGVFLVAMIVLSWRMCRVYGWQTFKRIGASQVMNRAYRLVLAFSIHLQVAVYFFVTSSALWVDELLNGSVACFAEHREIYKGIFITSILLLLPWLILGWIGVRRENKHMMHAFLVISLLFITAWAAMFASDVYRWTFATWPFFAAMTVISYVVLVATTGLAVVCRYNFKKGLALFLRSQQILPSADFTDAIPDPEKVGFPTQRSGGELPTFSVAFGQGGNPQPPSQMFPAQPAPAVTAHNEQPVGYSVNPYATNGSDFWGTDSITTTQSGSVRSKSSVDTSTRATSRETTETSDSDVPRYSVEDTNPHPSTIRRELPQWQEVRRSQLSHLDELDLRPQPQIHHQIQADRSSVYSSGTSGTGQFEVLRDGRWQRVDARELYRSSIVSGVTHASGFSGASWAPGDDAGPLPSRPPVPPVPAYPSQRAPPPPAMATRGFAGLPGKNVRPQKTPSGRITQQFSPPNATGVLGGAAVPQGW